MNTIGHFTPNSDSLATMMQSLVGAAAPQPIAVAPAGEASAWGSTFGFALPRDEQIATLLTQGQSRFAVAKDMGLAPATVYNVVQTPVFVAAFHKMQLAFREDAAAQKTRIEGLASQGLDRIADILYNSEDAELVGKLSVAMIDRAGHAVRQHLDVSSVHVHIDAEAGECIEAAFKELKEAEAALVEA